MKIKLLNKVIIFIVIFLLVFILAFKIGNDRDPKRYIFSWKNEEIREDCQELFATMKELKVNNVYQHFSRDVDQSDIEGFLKAAKNHHIEVSFLAGSPEWALDKTGEPMIKAIEKVVDVNNHLDGKYRIKSIVFDVEPHTLDEWNEENKEKIMNTFVKGMKAAYKKGNENNLSITVCIPFYYDKMGFSKQVKELIKSGCDNIAIMNYLKGHEIKNIKKEVEYAKRYGKKLVNIYELQEAGKHGLKDQNTYNKDGILAVEENFKNMQKEFGRKNLGIAFHDYKAVKEVLKRE